MALDKFVDMELDDEDQIDAGVCCGPAPDSVQKLIPQYPWGLRISLTQSELDKLDLDVSEVEAKDYVHLKVLARITNRSCESMVDLFTGEKKEVSRLELQIEKIAVDDEGGA